MFIPIGCLNMTIKQMCRVMLHQCNLLNFLHQHFQNSPDVLETIIVLTYSKHKCSGPLCLNKFTYCWYKVFGNKHFFINGTKLIISLNWKYNFYLFWTWQERIMLHQVSNSFELSWILNTLPPTNPTSF